jgi:hypothetical protein
MSSPVINIIFGGSEALPRTKAVRKTQTKNEIRYLFRDFMNGAISN